MEHLPGPLAVALRSAGVDDGDILLFEMRDAKPEGTAFPHIVASLQGLVGEGGTVVVPTCTDTEGRPKPTFDPALSPSEAGPFSEFFLHLSGVERSHSTTHSVAALGPGALRLTAGHRAAQGRPTPWGEEAFGHGSPWDLLLDANAWWVVVGDGWEHSYFARFVQTLYAEQHAGITREMPFPRFSGAALGRKLETLGIAHRTGWDGGTLVAFRCGDAMRAALEELERAPAAVQPSPEFAEWLALTERIKQRGYLRAGAAKVAITPPVPCRRWDGKRMDSVERDLYARALALEHNGRRIVLLACDLLGISLHITQEVRAEITRRVGWPAGGVMITCTHAHSTPDTVGAGNDDPVYLAELIDAIATSACDAIAALRPARLGWGRVPVRGLARSRRVRMKDGSVFTTRYGVPSTWRVDPSLIAGTGDIDPDLTVVRVEDLGGQVIALVSNFGCHSSVALMSSGLSGDYPGEAMYAVEQALGAGGVVLFTMGAAADVDPTLEMPFWGPRTFASARRLGRIFAGQLLEQAERVQVTDGVTVAAERVTVDLPVRADWIHLVRAEQARLRQEFAAVTVDNPVINAALETGAIRTEVQALRLGDLALVGMPGEVFAETGLQVKASAGLRNVAVAELTNDCAGYLLTPKIEQEGGYEAGLHLFTRVTAASEAILLRAAEGLVATLFGAQQ